jgi:hypothetical protein
MSPAFTLTTFHAEHSRSGSHNLCSLVSPFIFNFVLVPVVPLPSEPPTSFSSYFIAFVSQFLNFFRRLFSWTTRFLSVGFHPTALLAQSRPSPPTQFPPPNLYKSSLIPPPPPKFTLKLATAVFAEIFEHLQHSTGVFPKAEVNTRKSMGNNRRRTEVAEVNFLRPVAERHLTISQGEWRNKKGIQTEQKYSKHSSTRGIRSSKAARSVNSRWSNSVLYGINGDTGTRPWKAKVNKQKKS